MDFMERLDRWQRVCVGLAVIGLLIAAAWVFLVFPQTDAKLARQLAAPECQPVRALPAEEIKPHGLSKEQYAIYLQCEALFWYRAQHPESSLTPAGYQEQLRSERRGLVARVFLMWVLAVAGLFLVGFVVARAFGRDRAHGGIE